MYDSAVLCSVVWGIQLTVLLQSYIGAVLFDKNTRRKESLLRFFSKALGRTRSFGKSSDKWLGMTKEDNVKVTVKFLNLPVKSEYFN
jgi:hypothetical protein